MSVEREPVREDPSFLRHFGLPFYYRHKPRPALGRAVFWLASLGVIGLISCNLVMFPSEPNSLLNTIRRTLDFPRYQTFEEGLRYLFYQCYIIALILSGAISPLLATFSLANERVTGTLEFLRLSPMSALSIVLGKMFAPSYAVHILSGTLLGFGTVFGLFSGLPLGKVAHGLLAVAIGCVTLHALGVLWACITVTFRGFGALLGFLIVGFLLSVPPIGFGYEPYITYLSFLSPWGALNTLFWRPDYRWNGRLGPPELFGMPELAPFLTFAIHAVLIFLLVLAAVRKLDDPERPALPHRGYLWLWIFCLLLALGTGMNISENQGFRNESWVGASILAFFTGAGIAFLALLDHPFSREQTLSAECERIAGREQPLRYGLRGYRHSLFVSALVLLSGAAIMAFSRIGMAQLKPNYPYPWVAVLASLAAVVFFTFLTTLLLEIVSLRYENPSPRTVGYMLAIALLVASFLVPIVHTGQVYANWNSSLWMAMERVSNNASTNQSFHYYSRHSPQPIDFELYAGDLKTPADVIATRERFNDAPCEVMFYYHPRAAAGYLLFFLGMVAGIFGLRTGTYRALRKEARRAMLEIVRPVAEEAPDEPAPTPNERKGAVAEGLPTGGIS